MLYALLACDLNTLHHCIHCTLLPLQIVSRELRREGESKHCWLEDQRMETGQVQGFCRIRILGLLLITVASSVNGRYISTPDPVSPCQAPLQWEGRIVVYDHNTGKNTRANVTYDAKQQRIRILEDRKNLVPCKR